MEQNRQIIQHYRTSGTTLPNVMDINYGEIAVNYKKGNAKLLTRLSDDSIAEFYDKDNVTRAINLVDYADGSTFTCDGPFEVYIKIDDGEGGVEIYQSSHHRYTDNERVDCLKHVIGDNKISPNEGYIYSILDRYPDGITYKVNGYVTTELNVLLNEALEPIENSEGEYIESIANIKTIFNEGGISYVNIEDLRKGEDVVISGPVGFYYQNEDYLYMERGCKSLISDDEEWIVVQLYSGVDSSFNEISGTYVVISKNRTRNTYNVYTFYDTFYDEVYEKDMVTIADNIKTNDTKDLVYNFYGVETEKRLKAVEKSLDGVNEILENILYT